MTPRRDAASLRESKAWMKLENAALDQSEFRGAVHLVVINRFFVRWDVVVNRGSELRATNRLDQPFVQP